VTGLTLKSDPRPAEIEPLALSPEELLDRVLAIGALPSATQRLLSLTRTEGAELAPVIEALSQNPSLAAAVLRLANSSAYGQSRGVADLHRAVMIVGMQELHDVVAGTAMLGAFARPDPVSEYLQATAGLSAVIAQKLSAQLGRGAPATAYLAGLMCELGALACLALDPDFSELHLASEGNARQRFATENARYHGTTAALGGRILQASGLPSEVAAAVSTTGLEPPGEAPPLGRIVAFARLAAVALLQAAEHGDPDVLTSDLTVSATTVGLDDVEPELLVRTCLAAAPSAELTLQGELATMQSAAENDNARAPGLRTTLRPIRPRGPAFYVAMCTGAAAIGGAVAWLLLR